MKLNVIFGTEVASTLESQFSADVMGPLLIMQASLLIGLGKSMIAN
jgi:hypothetical protein